MNRQDAKDARTKKRRERVSGCALALSPIAYPLTTDD
jgi:hypothetical protein